MEGVVHKLSNFGRREGFLYTIWRIFTQRGHPDSTKTKKENLYIIYELRLIFCVNFLKINGNFWKTSEKSKIIK